MPKEKHSSHFDSVYMRPCDVAGVTLDVGKKYSQTVERGFHISMAALEPQQNKGEIYQIRCAAVKIISNQNFLIYGNIRYV